jgi:Protein of unknown function (DUF2637)
VPTRGTRPERVAAFLALNPEFARPARASQAKQWGGARGREEVGLLGPRVTRAAWDENAQPSQHRVATVTRRAVQARLQARQQRSAQRVEQTRTHDLAARTHQRLLARQPANATRPADDRIGRDPTVSTGSVIVNAELARLLREGRWVQPTSAAGVLGIGAAAFLLSYDALHSLALASGVRPGLARIWPGGLDGFIVATLTVVAAEQASRSTWYPWALVVLFSAASVAFNILHALDQALAPAGWVAAMVFAMPPVALVLATHLLLQQGVWRRQHSGTATAMADQSDQAATPSSPEASTNSARGRHRLSEAAPTALAAANRLPTPSPPRQPADAATRDRARQLYVEAQAAGRKLTGADLGRALGTSDSYGRLLLREFRTSSTAPENGTPREA